METTDGEYFTLLDDSMPDLTVNLDADIINLSLATQTASNNTLEKFNNSLNS